ncbi:BAH and coiled-coil domain-containing protein 1-like isoform X2 [Lineus longissimus]|uniref:BAH and coiled-coil domain-containing protein 1-like isoform X2 n=1 Tax=Lineus longissimus TaxID=88925 RepID=UPI00315DDBB0
MAGRPDYTLDRTRLLQGDPTGLSHGSAGMLAQYAAAAAENAALAARQVGLAEIPGASPLAALGHLPGQYPTDRYYPPSMSIHGQGSSYPWSSYLNPAGAPPSSAADAYKSLMPSSIPHVWPHALSSEGYAAYGLGAYSPYMPYLHGAGDTPIFSQALSGLNQSSAVYHRIYDLHKEAKPPDIGVHGGLGQTLMTPHASLSYGRPNLTAACSPMASPNVTPISQPLIKSETRMDRPCHHEEPRKRTETRERASYSRNSNPAKATKAEGEAKFKQKGNSVKQENSKSKSCAGDKRKPQQCHNPENAKQDRTKSNQTNNAKCEKDGSTIPKMEERTSLIKNKPVQSNHPTAALACSANVGVKSESPKEAQCSAIKATAPKEASAGEEKPQPTTPLPAIVKKPSLEKEKAILKNTIFKVEPGDMCISSCSEKPKENSVRVPRGHEQRSHKERSKGKPKEELSVKHFSPDTGFKTDPEDGEEIDVEIERSQVEVKIDDIKPLKDEHDDALASCKKEPLDVKPGESSCQSASVKAEPPKSEAQESQDTSTNSASSSPSVSDTSSGFAPAIVVPGTETSAMVTSTSPGGGVYAMYPSTLPMAAYIGQNPGPSILTTDGKPLTPYSTATAHLMPLYQSLYSLSKEEACKEGKKVHATTFTPEVGVLPTVATLAATGSSSPLKDKVKNDQNRNYLQPVSPRDEISVTPGGSPSAVKDKEGTKAKHGEKKSSSRRDTDSDVSNRNTPVDNVISKTEKRDSSCGSSDTGSIPSVALVTAPDRTTENENVATNVTEMSPLQHQMGDKNSIPLSMPYRDIIHDYGQPRHHVTLTEAHMSPQASEAMKDNIPEQIDRRLYDWTQYNIASSSLSPPGYLFTSQIQVPTATYSSEEERRRLVDSGWIPGQPTTPVPNPGLGSPPDLKPVIPMDGSVSSDQSPVQATAPASTTDYKQENGKSVVESHTLSRQNGAGNGDGSHTNEKPPAGGSKSTEEAVTMAITGPATIPIGIAVARQRQDNNKDSKEANNANHDSAQQRQNREREEFLREQKELLATQSKGEATAVHRDIKTELGSNLIVTGGNTTGSVIPWRDNDPSRSLSSHWLQAGGTMAPTYWLGQSPYSITHPAVHLPNVDPSHIPMTPPGGGYKLAQDPMTGQLFLIPATNIDVIDPSRLWSGLTGSAPLQSIIAQPPSNQIQQPTTTAQPQPQPQKVSNFPVPIGSATHQIHVPKTEEISVTDRQDEQKQSDRSAPVVPDPITNSAADDSTSPFLSRVPVSCGTGQPYAYPYPATPLPYFYDPSVIPVHGVSMAENLITRPEPSVQSRGTSPMTITSAASPLPDQESADLQEDITLDQSKLITHSTISVQTSPDAEQMSEMREQSCQTSETEKEAQDESEDEREKQRNENVTIKLDEIEKPHTKHFDSKENEHVDPKDNVVNVGKQKVESVGQKPKSVIVGPNQRIDGLGQQQEKCDSKGEAVECDVVEAKTESEIQRQQGLVEEVRVCDKRSTILCCDNIFDIIGDIHKNKTNALDALCCATQMTNALEEMRKESEKEVLIDNSYKNLESNMASSYGVKHDVAVISVAQGGQDLDPVDGLALLSAMAEKRAEEEQRVVVNQQKEKSSGAIKKEPEMFVFNTDINRNYEGTAMRSPPLSSCSSPTFVFKRERKDSASWSPLSGDSRLFGSKNDAETMDASEFEMRMKMAELQRKYKEKQKELARLQPRNLSKSDDDRNSKRGPGRPKKRKLSKQDTAEEKSPDHQEEPRKKHKKRHAKEDDEEKKDKKRKEDKRSEQHRQHRLEKQCSEDSVRSESKLLSRSISDGSTSSSDIPLAQVQQRMKRTESTESSTADAGFSSGFSDRGLQLLAKYASTEPDVVNEPKPKKKKIEKGEIKQEAIPTILTPVSNKRKPGRPKKLSPEQPSETETIVAKKPKTLGLLHMKEKSKDMDKPLNVHIDSDMKPPIFLDGDWNIRRSERIFLSDATSPQASPSIGPPNKDTPLKSPMKLSPSKVPLASPRKLTTDKKPCKQIVSPSSSSEKGEKPKRVTTPKPHKPKSSPPSAFPFKEKLKYKYVYSSSDSSSESDSEGDNVPLSELKEKPQTTEPRNCTIDVDNLVDGLRVLVLMSNLFYEAEVKAIQPPDIYGVVIFGERGGRPHIMTQEEVLKEAVIDVQPSSPKFLPEGTRVCAYWSQQFSCLYPGTVEKESPNPDVDKNLINVEFDDGDSGKIPIDHIRMLPANFPLCTFSSSEPSPLLLANKRMKRFSSDSAATDVLKERKPSISESLPNLTTVSEEPKKGTSKRGPGRPKKLKLDSETGIETGSFEMSTISEQLENIVFKPEKKKSKEKMKDSKKDSQDGKGVAKRVKDGGAEVKKKTKFTNDIDMKKEKSEAKKKSSIISESHFAKAAEFGKLGLGDESSSSEDSSDDEEEDDSSSAESSNNESSASESESSNATSSVTSSVDKKRKRKEKERKRARRQSSENKSKIAAFLPARQLWRWSGKGTRRPGMKGKAKKEYYKAITRGRETIKVGDSAVFMSTGRPHLPYVGHIESFWEGWGGNMVVKVTWFYHPEETKGGKKLIKMKGALYESPHGDENDVQTISHKCEVLSYTDYKRRKISSENDNNDVYYLAGNYDPIVGTVVFESDVMHT